jgi:hypothetical protein
MVSVHRADISIETDFQAIGTLLLAEPNLGAEASRRFQGAIEHISKLNREELQHLLEQAETQRVLRRTLATLDENLDKLKQASARGLLATRLTEEDLRVEKALYYLQQIVRRLELSAIPVMIMKTLDHWPDTGSDLDLLVSAKDSEVCEIFDGDFHASRQPQSWGDRLAHKFNFKIPELKELVEVHVGCLGQTGEHSALASDALSRRQYRQFGAFSFPVPSYEDQIVIATLQRMYRHYYIRLTDIVNIDLLVAGNAVDFDKIQAIAEAASIWPGVATLITVACQYAVSCGAMPVDLPGNVNTATRFNSSRTYLDRKFLRVPLVPEATNLFLRQLAGNGRSHNFAAIARLSLLPVLATAAYLSFRFTGDDKGVW